MTETVAAIEEDIRRLAEQERLLRIARFGPQEAFALGLIVREIALARAAPIAIDISLRDRPLFHCALPGSTTDNAEWIRRKRNTVLRLWRSSYAVGRSLALSGKSQEAALMLPLTDFAVHGGGFPLTLEGLGCIGALHRLRRSPTRRPLHRLRRPGRVPERRSQGMPAAGRWRGVMRALSPAPLHRHIRANAKRSPVRRSAPPSPAARKINSRSPRREICERWRAWAGGADKAAERGDGAAPIPANSSTIGPPASGSAPP